MASLAAPRVKNATLTTTTVDDVTITGSWPLIEVLNRAAAPSTIWVTVDGDDPTDAGDDCLPVGGGERVVVANKHDASGGTVVRILGNGDAYSVIGTTR